MVLTCGESDEWTVSHIPTGTAICRRVEKLSEAIRIAEIAARFPEKLPSQFGDIQEKEIHRLFVKHMEEHGAGWREGTAS
jgi:hypothetical protein